MLHDFLHGRCDLSKLDVHELRSQKNTRLHPQLYPAYQEAKLVESRKLLAEERQASLATSALQRRDLVLKLRQVLPRLPSMCLFLLHMSRLSFSLLHHASG